ncbi:MAG: hypothetical protein JO073_08625 [Actinobacteria bacterium]|nr:hypothetical protein [Actinomycetota bacterium]
MVSSMWRLGACVLGFGFGAVWMTAGLGSAIVSLLIAGVFYGIAVAVQRRDLSRRTTRFFEGSSRPERRRPERRRVEVEPEPGW